nr:hypothetical protein [Ruegeria arenilitoris]
MTLVIGDKPLPARYTDIQSVDTNQTAHISLQLSNNVKEQTTKTKKQDHHANKSAQPPNPLPQMPTVSPMRPANSPARHQTHKDPVKRLLSPTQYFRKKKKTKVQKKSRFGKTFCKNSYLND